jgi:predicted RNase H-like HicB family nuclease
MWQLVIGTFLNECLDVAQSIKGDGARYRQGRRMARVSKAMRSYIAIICKEPGSAWGVHFPDLPGCTSAGTTMDEAVENAGKALRLWAEDETELPKAPSTACASALMCGRTWRPAVWPCTCR